MKDHSYHEEQGKCLSLAESRTDDCFLAESKEKRNLNFHIIAKAILTHFENFLASKHKLVIYKNETVSVIILPVQLLSVQSSPCS